MKDRRLPESVALMPDRVDVVLLDEVTFASDARLRGRLVVSAIASRNALGRSIRASSEADSRSSDSPSACSAVISRLRCDLLGRSVVLSSGGGKGVGAL